jgi:PLP dependent protein
MEKARRAMGMIKENIDTINRNKDDITVRSGRKAGEVLLVAVTKTRTSEEINEAIDAGITDIGENKVQEIMDKFEAVKPVRWHMIGHLQTNKVKYIIDKVSMIHSVDSFHLAEEIDKRAEQHGTAMDILVQVNTAEEDSKFGITSEETGKLIEEILERCPNIKIKGLMCIAPFEDDPEDVRIFFKETKKLYDKYSLLTHPRLDFQFLSMGMSHDYEAAIQEGSNLIRVGTAIFGDRNYNKQI